MRTYLFPSCLKYAVLWVGICLSVAPASAASYWWNSTGSGSGTGGSGTWNTSSALWKTTAGGSSYQAWPNSEGSPSAAEFLNTSGGTLTIAADTEIYANGLNFSNVNSLSPWRLQSGNGASRLVLSGATNTITVGTTPGNYTDFAAVFNTQVELRGTTTLGGTTSSRVGIGTNPTSSSTSGSLTIASGGIANFFSSGTRTSMFAVGHQAGTLSGGVSSVTGSADFTGGRMSLYTRNLTVGAMSTDNAGGANSAPVTGTFTSGTDSGTVLNSDQASVVGQVWINNSSATYVGTASGTLNWQGGTATFSNPSTAASALIVGRFLSVAGTNINSTNVAAASGTLNISGGTFEIGSTDVNQAALLLAFRSTNLGVNSTASGTVNLTGGTLNITALTGDGGDISGGGGTSTFNLDGGTLDLNGNELGRAVGLITTLNFRSGTLRDVFQINAGAALNKTSAGTLTLSGFNRYTGDTTISEGTVSAGNIVVASGYSDLGNSATAVALGAASTKGTLSYTGNTATYIRGFTIGNGGGQLDVTTSGQTLTVGTGAITGTAGLLTVGGAGNTTITSAITTGTGGLTKTGAGTLTLSSAGNTFTGLTTVTQGTLAYGIANALSSGAVTVNGGTLALGGFNDGVGAVTLTSGSITGTGGILTGTSYAVESGSISAILAGAVNLSKSTSGTVALTGVNTYSGTSTLSDGVLQAGNNAAFGTSALALNGGTLSSDSITARAFGNAVTFGGNVTLGNLTNTGALTFNGVGNLTGSRTVTTASAVTYANVISGGANSLTKAGAGTLTFSAANTYTGATIVSAGSLVLSTTGSVASSLIQVQTGAEFDGSAVSGGFELKNNQRLENKGTFTGNLTALSGSTYAPGNSPGIATQAGDLTFNTGSTFEWELIANTDAVAGTNFDQTVFTSGGLTIQTGVTANLVFNAGSTVDWANAFWGSDQQWLVFSGASSLSNVAGIFTNITVGVDAFSQSLASARSGASFSFTNVGNDVYLTYSIPEPSTTLLLAGALTALVIFRRRRQ